MRKLQDNCLGKILGCTGIVKLGVVAFIGLIAATSWAQPANDLFNNAITIKGATGTTNGNNVGATAEAGEPDHADNPGGPYSTIWYQWKATANSVLEFDTQGSVIDTEIAVYTQTGTNTAAVTNLTLIAQNEDVGYPSNLTSKVTFTVTPGTTYYIAIDGYEGSQGATTLNWQTLKSSLNAGQFEFAISSSAPHYKGAPVYLASDDESMPHPNFASFMGTPSTRLTVTRVGGHAGRVQAYYQVTNTFYTNLVFTNVYGTNITITNGAFFTNVFFTNFVVINTLQQMDRTGKLITLTITNDTEVFGTNQDHGFRSITITNVGTNFVPFCANVLSVSTDAIPWFTNFFCTNLPIYTNLIPTATNGFDYFAGGGVLDFLDYQMSSDITNIFVLPVSSLSPFFTRDNVGPFYLNRLLVVNLTNVVFDSDETTNIGPPTISTTLGTAYMNVLSQDSIGTNQFYGNSGDIWNIDHVEFRYYEPNGGKARVWVSWAGTNVNGPPGSETLTYRLDFGNVPDDNDAFPLLPGSDYATPPNAAPASSQQPDFTDTSGTFTWTPNSPYFDIPITNDGIVEFNEDILVNLHAVSSGNLGQVTNATMTIIFNDQPAGAQDRDYNPNNAGYFVSDPDNSFPGADGDVNAVVIQPADGKAIIAGSFFSYNEKQCNRIARVNTDGSFDTSFLYGPNSGTDGTIKCLALQANGDIIIGGLFTTYTGIPRPGIARLNPDGTLDTSFNPGLGITGGNNIGLPSVSSVQVQNDGQILIAGNFTFYNSTNYNYIVRLNQDGSIDPTFNAGAGPQGTFSSPPVINAMAIQTDGKVVIGGQFNSVASAALTNIARLNTNGTVDTTFTPGAGADGPVFAVGLQPNGGINNIIIGGAFNNVDLVSSKSIARLNPNGTIDESFNIGTGADDIVYTLLVYPSTDTNVGKILIGGAFASFNGTRRVGLARLFSNGPVDTTFLDTAYNQFAGLINNYYDQSFEPRNYLRALGLQSDGNVLIGGNFYQLGGDGNSPGADGGARDAIAPRGYFTRVIGNSTPGPGNIGFTVTNYSATINGGPYFVQLVRTNGFGINGLCLGPASVTFSIPTPAGGSDTNGIAIAGTDYTFDSATYGTPTWGTSYTFANDWMTSDGLFGLGSHTRAWPNVLFDISSASSVFINITDTNLLAGNRLMNLTLSQPSSSDLFFLGGENIPIGVGLGVAQAQLEIIDNYQPHGTLSFSSPTYTVNENGTNAIISVIRTGGSKGTISATCATVKSLDIVPPTAVYSAWGGGGHIGRNVYLMALRANTPYIYFGNTNINQGVWDQNGGTEYSHWTGSGGSPVFTVPADGNYAVFSTAAAGTPVTDNISLASTAVSGTTNDYIATIVQPLTFNDGVTNQQFIIPIINNTIVRPDRTVVLQLSNPTGGGNLGQSNAVLTIINDNVQAGMLSFTGTSYTAEENSGHATINVTRTGGSSGVISIYYATSNGTATNGLDYNGITNTLTWNSGDTSVKSFTIPLINNGLVSSNKTVNLRLFNPVTGILGGSGVTNNNALGQYTNATLTINNDNFFGNLVFSTPTYTVNENAGFATITVLRLGGSSQSISVNFTTAPGTATTPYNYTTTNGTLTFGPGVFTQTFTVPINDNLFGDQYNTNLFLSLSLSTNGLSTGAGLGSPSTATLQIINNETFNQPPGGTDNIFDANAFFNNTVYSLALQSDGALVAGGDFTAADGIPRNRIARLNSDGTLDVKFSSTSQVEGADGSVRSVVVQSDGRILVGGLFTKFNNGTFNYIARLNYDGSLDNTFNVSAGADNPVYAIAETFDTNGNRKIIIGGSFVSVNLNHYPGVAQLNGDGSVDTSFNATGANDTVYAVAVYSTNDVLNGGKILIGGDFTSVNGVPRNHIARLNTDGSLDTAFNPGAGPNGSVRAIAIQVDGNVLIGGLFTFVTGNPLNYIARLTPDGSVDPMFSPGVGANGVVTCIAIQEDQKIVLGGGFTQANGVTRNRLTRLNPDGTVDPGINFGLGANDFVSTLVIQPNDEIVFGGGFTQYNNQSAPYIARIFGRSASGPGTLTFVSTNYQVAQNGTNAIIGVRRDGPTGELSIGNVYVTFSTSDSNAVAGVDYVGVTNTLTFPVGETFETVTVPIINTSSNGIVAPNKIVKLTLSNPTVADLGVQPVSQLTIININSSIGFSTPTYRVIKNTPNGAAVIAVTRGGSAVGTASVDFITTTNGTAMPQVDYIPKTNTIFFADGQSNATVSVTVINNGLLEGTTTVGMMLLNPTNVILSSQNAAATLSIVDNSTATGNFIFSATNYTVLGTSTNAVITVIRTNGSINTISVNYATTGGTATAGVDYAATNGTLSFEEGILSQSFVVPIFANVNLTSNVTVNLTLSNPSGTSQILAPATVPLTILNQNVDLNFAQYGYFVDETNGSVTIGVTRSGNTNVGVSVQYATSTTNSSAGAGTNYTTTSGTLNFGIGQTFQTFTIPILYDPRITGNLVFYVNLLNPSGSGQLIAPISTVVTINDDDTGFEFAAATNSVAKANTNVVISVLRLGNVSGLASVSFNSLGGTAVTGIEYAPTNGVLTFTNGQASNSFTVPIFNDNQIDGDQTVNLNLSSPVGGQLLSPSTEVLTIIDTESGFSFSSSGFTVTENGNAATITVVRTGVTNTTVSVNYATTTNGNAVAGSQYLVTSGTLIFTNGQISQTFPVTIIDNNVTGGTETVGLALLAPSPGATLAAPNTATLTIFNNDGSLIVPAGSALTAPTNGNGAINPSQTVTLLLALRNTAGSNTTNLMATLLATNGVTSPSPSGAQSYGVLVTNGPSVSRQYTFTASGTNGASISAVLQLQDGTRNLGTASFPFILGTITNNFTNNAVITINDNTLASPYPSTIAVAGVTGSISKLTATLNRLGHGSMSDVCVLLVGPTGQEELLMGNVGGRHTVTNLNLTFDDSGTAFTTNAPGSGVYQPTQLPLPFQPLQTINFPASTNGSTLLPGPYGLSLSSFIGSPLNGTWSLYVLDDVAAFGGSVNNGWSLSINSVNVVTPTVDLVVGMTASPSSVVVSSNLTYSISVTNAGPSTATNLIVTDTLPAGAVFVQCSASGSYSTNTGAVTFNLGSLPLNGVTNMTLVLSPTITGTISNTVYAAASQLEANPTNNSASLVTAVSGATADLAIGMVDAPDPVQVGNSITYTISVTNLGPATATNVIVTNVLPAGTLFVSASGSYSTNAGVVTFNLGNLGGGAIGTASLVVQSTAAGTITDNAGVSSGVGDPFKGNNTASVKTVAQLQLSAIHAAAGGLKFSWSAAASGYVLKSTPSIKPPVTWTTVTNGMVLSNGQCNVTVPIAPGSKFFKLAPGP